MAKKIIPNALYAGALGQLKKELAMAATGIIARQATTGLKLAIWPKIQYFG
jgi:hypothetical protein